MPEAVSSFQPAAAPAATWQPTVAALLLHAGLLTALYSALYCVGVLTTLPTNKSLLSWDVVDLLNVARDGYPDASRGYNAFFPLMPLTWRFAGLDLLGASLLNAGLTLAGIYLLARTFALTGRQVLLIASAPLLMFAVVPYAEGFFFFFSAVLLRGLHLQRLPLTLLGLLGCGLTRSAGTLFVPAYLFAELLAWGELSTGRIVLRNIVAGLLAMVASVGAVMLLQYSQHGDPFAFYKVHALWGQRIQLPTYPWHSSAGSTMLWLDLSNLIVSLLAVGACLVLGLRWLRQRWQGTVQLGVSKAVLFALGYCVGASGFVVLSQGGDLVGISRYLMGTAFWGTLLAWMWRSAWPRRYALAALAGAWLLAIWAAGFPTRFDSFAPGEALWYFGLTGGYVAAYWFAQPGRSRWSREISTGLYCMNLLFLCILLNLFLTHVWVN